MLKGSEVLKLKTLLGENPSHTDRLKNTTTAEGLQNYLNDHDLHLVLKNGEPHLIDELNNEVYALRDLSNLKGVLQSEEAKNFYTTDLDSAISIKPIEVIEKQKIELDERQSLNLLPSGEGEDEDKRKRKKQSYGY